MLTIKSSTQILNPESNKAHISSLLIPLPDKKGSIFGLIKFLGKSNKTRELISETIHERLTRFKDTIEGDVHIARRFEQLLQAINEDIAQIISENAQFPLSDIHIVIGVIHDNKVFLSGLGNLSALFMHRTAQQRYVIYELAEQFINKEDQKWDKLFATVLDGELHPGDIFYIATRISARELTLAELQDILTTLPASGSLKRIQQFLNRDTVYGGICFQISNKPESNILKKVNPMHSVDHLDKTKEETSTLLGDQAPDISNFISKLTKPLIKKLSAPGTRGYKSLAKRFIKVILQIFTIILAGIVKVTTLVIKQIFNILKKIPSVARKGKHIAKQHPNPKERFTELIKWFNALTPTTKYIGLGLTVIAIILMISLTVSSKSQTKQNQENTFNAITTHIEEKIDAASASLIYNDENQARILLQEATTLIETIDTKTRSQSDSVEDLKLELKNILNDIQKINIAEPSLLAENKTLIMQSSIQINDTIYSIDSNDNLYRLNTLESTWQIIETSTGAIEQIIYSTSTEDGEILFVDSNQQLGRLSIDNATLNPIVSGSNDLLSIEGLIEYNDSIYILSASGKQIIKMRERGDGYEAGTPWINSTDSETDLSFARSIAIDGNIYVLTNDKILSFLSGKQQTFELNSISPTLKNPTSIWTDSDSEYIYILEPDESRIIVIDKTGILIAQYINDTITDAHSMIVQESSNSIIIISDTSAYTFTADHLLQ